MSATFRLCEYSYRAGEKQMERIVVNGLHRDDEKNVKRASIQFITVNHIGDYGSYAQIKASIYLIYWK